MEGKIPWQVGHRTDFSRQPGKAAVDQDMGHARVFLNPVRKVIQVALVVLQSTTGSGVAASSTSGFSVSLHQPVGPRAGVGR